MMRSLRSCFRQTTQPVFTPADPGCSSNNSADWLQKNLGAFSALLSFHDMQMLFSNFSAVPPVASSVLLCEMICFILRCVLLCVFSDGRLAIPDSQTASGGLLHSWPAQICRPGQHGDEPRPKPTTVHLLRLLLTCYQGELEHGRPNGSCQAPRVVIEAAFITLKYIP